MKKFTFVLHVLLGIVFSTAAQTAPCAEVMELKVVGTTMNTATVNWNSISGLETSWEIAVGTAADLNPSTATVTSTTVNFEKTITGLQAATSYKVWVRALCGTEPSAWVGPVPFNTACPAVASFSENFDTTASLTLPMCWSKILAGPGLAPNANVRTIALYPHSGTNSLQLSSAGSTADCSITAVSPNLSTLALGTYRLKFYAKGVGSLEVGTVSDATNNGIFTSVENVQTTANYLQYIVEFSSYTGTDPFVGIQLSSFEPSSTIYIDDVVWEPIPLCPDATDVSVNNVIATTAEVNWASNPDVSTWHIALGAATDTDPSTLSFSATQNEAGFLLESLTPNTTYKVWMRSVCGTDNGNWTLPVSFTTACAAVASVSQNFDNALAPQLPDCWSKIIRGATVGTDAAVATSVTPNSNSGTQAVRLFNANSTGVYDIILVSPLLEANTVNASRVKFFANAVSEGASVDVVALSSNSASATYTVIQTIPLDYDMTSYSVTLDGAPAAARYVGFRLNATSDYKTIHIDDVVIEPIPLCADVSALAIADLTQNSASLTWIPTGFESAWEVVYGPASVTDPATLTPQNAASPNFFFTDLTPATPYKVWARSVCSGTVGGWVGPLSFTTNCGTTTVINENFDDTTLLTLPLCWTSILRNGAVSDSDVSVSYGGTMDTFALTIYASYSSAGSDAIAITPPVSTLGVANQLLTFSAYGTNPLIVGTLNSNAIDAVFTPFQTYALTEDTSVITVDFSTYSGTDTYIGFKLEAGNMETSSQYIAIDDVVYGPNLGTEGVTQTAAMVYPNPVDAELNIVSTKELQSVRIFNVMGQQVFVASESMQKLALGHLPQGAYFVHLNGADFTEVVKIIKK